MKFENLVNEENVEELIGFKNQIESSCKQLIEEWKYFGHSTEGILTKKKILEIKHKKFFEETLIEEKEQRSWKEAEIEVMKVNARRYCELLDKKEPDLLKLTGAEMGPLLEFEIQLKKHLDQLTLELYNKLKEEAKEIGEIIAEAPPSNPRIERCEIKPDDGTITKLNYFIEQMKKEMEIRQSKIHELRVSIMEHQLTLGISPTEEEEIILKTQTILSKEFIEKLKGLKCQLEKKILEAETDCEEESSISGSPLPPAPVAPLTYDEMRKKFNNDIESLIGAAVGNISNLSNLLAGPSSRKKKSKISLTSTIRRSKDDEDNKNEICKVEDSSENKISIERTRENSPDLEIIEICENANTNKPEKSENKNEIKTTLPLKNLKPENGNFDWLTQEVEDKVKSKSKKFKRKSSSLNSTVKSDRGEEKRQIEPFTFGNGIKLSKDEIEIVDLSDNSDVESKREFPIKEKMESKANLKLKSKREFKGKSDAELRFRGSSSDSEGDDNYKNEKKKPRVNNGDDRGVRKWYSKEEDLKMLRIIGASNWHHHTTGYTIWDEMVEREEAFPYRSSNSLRSHFLLTLNRKLKVYGLSRAERKKYAFSYSQKIEGKRGHSTPMNLDFNNYNLF